MFKKTSRRCIRYKDRYAGNVSLEVSRDVCDSFMYPQGRDKELLEIESSLLDVAVQCKLESGLPDVREWQAATRTVMRVSS